MTVNPKSLANLTGGSRKGIPNRSSAKVRDMILEAFDLKGGVQYLMAIDDEEFNKLLGKVIPTAITGEDGGPLTIAVRDEMRVAAVEARDAVARLMAGDAATG
jgi:hypothetical protein